jgi:hypothetical protein
MSRLALLLCVAGCSFNAAQVPVAGDAALGGADARPGDGAIAVADAPVAQPDAPEPPPDAAPLDAPPPDAPPPDAPPPDGPTGGGTFFHYVTSSLRLGATPGEAEALAFDLDGDLRPDNKLGVAMATLSGSGITVDTELDEALRAGTMILLHSLEADGLFRDPQITWRTYRGTPRPDPDLESGSGMFTVAADSRTDSAVNGDLAAAEVVAGPGLLVIELALSDAPPIPVELIGARLTADVTAAGCSSGRLGGGIPSTHIDAVVLPAVAVALDARIAGDEGCREDFDACDATSQILLSLIDEDGDRFITIDEVRASPFVQAFVTPDVDLLDAGGDPGHDGVPDAVSLAVGFTCRRALFTAPGE